MCQDYVQFQVIVRGIFRRLSLFKSSLEALNTVGTTNTNKDYSIFSI